MEFPSIVGVCQLVVIVVEGYGIIAYREDMGRVI